MAGTYDDPYETWKSMGRPGGSFSAWMASQNATPEVGAAVQPTTGANLAAAPTSDQNFAQMIRNLAKSQNWSEDFARFDDNQINAWGQYWDPNAQKFRGGMYGGQEGFFEKPTECPPGTTLHGTNCIPMADAEEFWATGRITGAGAPKPAAVSAPQVDPGGIRGGIQPGGPYGGFMGGQNVVNTGSQVASRAPIQSDALMSALTPLQGQPKGLGVAPTLTQPRQGALAGLLTPLQKKQKPVGSWF